MARSAGWRRSPGVGGIRSLIGGMCASALLANSALAQTITVQPLTGVLSLNQGQGFHRVTGPVEANVGDSFMVGPGGSAKLIYPDGCQVTIQPGSVVNVTALSPCASGAQRPMPHPPSTYYPSAGAPLPGQPPGVPLNPPDSGDGFGTAALVGGGLVLLGGIGAGVYFLTKKSPAPASP